MQVKEFIKREIKKLAFKDVGYSDSLLKSGILDSITAVDLAVSIEEKYDIKIPFTDIGNQNFETIDTIVVYLESKFSLEKK
jgi:acyl carrier protein